MDVNNPQNRLDNLNKRLTKVEEHIDENGPTRYALRREARLERHISHLESLLNGQTGSSDTSSTDTTSTT